MKNKLIIGIFLLLVIIIGATLFITMNQNYIDIGQISSNLAIPKIPIFSFTILAMAVFLLLIILQTTIGQTRKNAIVSAGLFGLAFIVVMFINSINLSIGQLVKYYTLIDKTKNCISQNPIIVLKKLESEAPVNSYYVECSVYEKLISVLLPILVAALIATIFLWIFSLIKSLFKNSKHHSRIIVFFESLFWFLLLDIFLVNMQYDAVMLFINIFAYTLILYFLITTDTDDNKTTALVEVPKKSKEEKKLVTESEDAREIIENEDDFENEAPTPPRF